MHLINIRIIIGQVDDQIQKDMILNAIKDGDNQKISFDLVQEDLN